MEMFERTIVYVYNRVLMLSIIFLILTQNAAGCDVGTANPSGYVALTGGGTDLTFFIQSPASTCCGMLTTWKMYSFAAGTVTVEIWRPTAGSNYKLLSTEPFSVNVGLSTFAPSVNREIDVSDVIGWRTTGPELIPYDTGSGSSTQQQSIAYTAINTEVPWSQLPDTINTYAFGAVVTPNVNPVVTADAFTIDDTQTSTSVYTISVTDADTAVITNLQSVAITAGSSSFSVVKTASGWDLKTGATLTSGTYPLTVTATDRCGDNGTATITVTVNNKAPVFSPNPLQTVYPTAISDATTTAKSLYSFSVSDSDTITCSVNNSMFTLIDASPNIELWLTSVSTSALNYNIATSQRVTISCTDGHNPAITSTYTINISDEPPVLTGGLGGTSGPISDLSAAGTSVQQFTVNDQDDVISCSIGAPQSLSFTVVAVDGVAGTQRFDVKTSAGLNYDTTSSYTLTISCTDGQNTPVTGSLVVNLLDALPTLSGLPATSAQIWDGVQTAAQLGTFSVTDANDQASIACTIQAPANTLFDIKSGTAPAFQVWTKNGAILSAASAPYVLQITCVDNQPGNVVSGSYTVLVGNQAPAFVGTFPANSPSLSDDTVTATSLAKFTVSDIDANCSITTPTGTIYEIRKVASPANANQPEFEIWVGNAVTQASINYNSQPVPLVLTVQCTDGVNSPITGNFNVNIVDAAPVLTGLPGTTYTGLSDATTAAAKLTVFSVTDSDDTITCAIQPTSTSFEIRSGTYPEQEIWVKANPGLNYGVTPTYTLNIECTDGTTPAIVTGTKTINITNSPPVFVSMPATLSPSITDATASDTRLHSFSVTDTATAIITCTATSATPYNNDFQLRGTSPNFEIWVLAVNHLNYDSASSIPVTVACTDGFTTIKENFTVQLYDEDPVWTGLPAAGPYQNLADTTVSAVSLYTFSVSDSDDTITCSVGAPESTNFEVVSGTPPLFTIQYRGSPPATLNSDVQSSYNLSISCTDGASYTQTHTYNVQLSNSPPSFKNLPDSSPIISESETSKTLLYVVTVTDTTEALCYLADTVTAAGILPLEKSTVALPNTEYNVYAYHTTGFDYEGGTKLITIQITCGDSNNTISNTLLVHIANAAPVITNPSGSSTVAEDEAGSLVLKTLTFMQYDAADATCTMTNADGGPFTVINKNQIQKTAGLLDFEKKSFYNLDITCTDGLLTTTDTYRVNVQNKGPEITNLPLGGSIKEGQVSEVLLQALTVSENASSCVQVAPVQSEFAVKLEPTTNLWSIYYVSQAVAGKSLNYETNPFYDINVQCSDAAGAKGAPKTFTINVIDNKPPKFTNVAGNPVTKVTVLAKSVNAGASVYTLAGTDPEGDSIKYSMLSCTPNATCPFTVSPSGTITSTVDLHSHPNDFYTLSLKIEDKYNKDVPPSDLIIQIQDINTVPKITNLPLPDVVGFQENNAAGAVVYDVAAIDLDTPADVLTYTCDFLDGGEAYFSCNALTGEVKALAKIDYESMTQIEFGVNVHVNDGYSDSETKSFKIQILDVNEKPVFTKSTWTISKPDEGGADQTIDCPDWKSGLQDQDLNDVQKLTMSCPGGNGVFVMQDDGCIKMTKEWDLDAPSKRLGLDTITCTVTATDKGGLTATSTLKININEADDNTPYLDQTSYVYCATVGSTSGYLGQVSVSDKDVLPANRRENFQLIGGGPFSVDGTGALTYGDVSGYAKGTSFDMTLRVTDDGGNYSESKVTILICDPPPPSPPSPPSSSNSASSSSSSSKSSGGINSMLIWLIPSIILCALLLGLLAFLLRRCCLAGRCGSCYSATKPVRPINYVSTVKSMRTPEPASITPPPPKPRPAAIQPMELPIMHYYARDVGNLGNAYPTS